MSAWFRRLCDRVFNLGLVLGRRRPTVTAVDRAKAQSEAAMQELRRELEKRLQS